MDIQIQDERWDSDKDEAIQMSTFYNMEHFFISLEFYGCVPETLPMIHEFIPVIMLYGNGKQFMQTIQYFTTIETCATS